MLTQHSQLHYNSLPNLTHFAQVYTLRYIFYLDFITPKILGEEYKLFSSSLCHLVQSPFTSSLLRPNILLNTLFQNTLSFLSSHSVNDQVSHPHKTTGRTILLYILMFKYLVCNLEDKRFCTE